MGLARTGSVSLSCNANKTVCMVFTPKSRNITVSSEFLRLKIGHTFIQFVGSLNTLDIILLLISVVIPIY